MVPETENEKNIMRDVSKIVNLDNAKIEGLVDKHKIVGDAKGKDMEAPVDAPGGEEAEEGDAPQDGSGEEGKEEEGAQDGSGSGPNQGSSGSSGGPPAGSSGGPPGPPGPPGGEEKKDGDQGAKAKKARGRSPWRDEADEIINKPK